MIKCVSKLEFDKIKNDKQCNLFIEYCKDKWVACDNSTGDMWVEEFDNLDMAIRWLKGEFEVC